MPEKSYFRTAFGNQPVNGYETLLKSARHYYYLIFPSVWDKLSWKMSALVRSKILGLFVNTLTADPRILVAICRLSRNIFRRQYL